MKSSADLSPPRTAWDHFADPKSGLSGKKKLQLRVLVFVAHPDDETIGASSLISRVANVSVLFLTDGAPRDPCFWSPDAKGTREDYAQMRWHEATAAMALVNVSPERILWLGGVDQDAIHGLPVLVPRFVELLREQQPDIVVSHPYEGGHPDHDTAALIAHLGAKSLVRGGHKPATIVEMTSYHLRDSRCVTGEFLATNRIAPPELAVELSPEEQEIKKNMIVCYRSQRLVLEAYPVKAERFRLAPEYDFSRPPYPGKLWYECLRWPITGERWRELAVQALTQCDEAAWA
jgi:N-acetylglucosamine malate deacetylase 2